jgi:hypothetical protein
MKLVRRGNDDCIRLRAVEHLLETAVRVIDLKVGSCSASPIKGDVGYAD